jgi:hypothetical protein
LPQPEFNVWLKCELKIIISSSFFESHLKQGSHECLLVKTNFFTQLKLGNEFCSIQQKKVVTEKLLPLEVCIIKNSQAIQLKLEMNSGCNEQKKNSVETGQFMLLCNIQLNAIKLNHL